MAYETEKTYTQSGNTNKDFIVTFPFLATTDLRVQLNGTTKSLTSDYTIVQAGGTTTIRFNTAPADTNVIRIHRETDIDTVKHSFQAGSSISSSDLNNNSTQFLYASQEFGKLTTSGSSVLTTGNKGDITVNSTTDWVFNADSVEASHMANDAIETDAIKDEAVTADKIAPGALSNIAVANNSINADKLTSNSVTTVKITDGNVTEDKLASQSVSATKLKETTTSGLGFNPVGTVIWFAGSTAPTGYLKCNGDAIPNGTGNVQSVSSNFSALYAIVGSKLPDIRGEFIRGIRDGRSGIDETGVTAHTGSGGPTFTTTGILRTQTDLNKTHTHTADSDVHEGDGHSHTGSVAAARGVGGTTGSGDTHPKIGDSNRDFTTAENTTGITVQTGITAEGGTEARPRNIALLACIKY